MFSQFKKVTGIGDSNQLGFCPDIEVEREHRESVRTTTAEHIEEGCVDAYKRDEWLNGRRIQMSHIPEWSIQRNIHSSKVLNKLEAKVKRKVADSLGDTLAAEEINYDFTPCQFGFQMKQRHFGHISGLFFNTASYGCTPDIVINGKQALERRMQENNILWRFKTVPLRVRQAENALANVVKADPDDLTFVPNANYGTNAVLKNLPWKPGDVMLVFSCDYEATLNACEWLRWHHGVEIVTVDLRLPASDNEILRKVHATLDRLLGDNRLPKLANFCHVTSKTAFIFAAKDLVKLFHQYGVPVMIDGAQAAGHIDINVGDIAADYYVGTMHKWMYTAPGVGFLVVQPDKQKLVEPLVVSYFYGKGFVKEFSYTGLMDFTGYISAQYAIDFVKKVCGGYTKMRQYIHKLAIEATRLLTEMWGTRCIQGKPEHYGAMPIIQLPMFRENPTSVAAGALMLALLDRDITTFIYVDNFFGGKMMVIRLSCQIFHELSDFEELGRAILSVDPSRFFQASSDSGCPLCD